MAERKSAPRRLTRASRAQSHARLAPGCLHRRPCSSEPYRVGRRAHSERGWDPWDDPVSILQRYVNEPSGWSWTTRPSIHRNGQRFGRWARNLGSARNRCVGGCARPSATRANAGKRSGLTTDERERLKQLEREVSELRRANEILKKASAYFAQAELDRRAK